MSDQVNALDSASVTGCRVMVYDGNGNLISLTGEGSNITEYGYNAASLVERVNYSDGKQANLSYLFRHALQQLKTVHKGSRQKP